MSEKIIFDLHNHLIHSKNQNEKNNKFNEWLSLYFDIRSIYKDKVKIFAITDHLDDINSEQKLSTYLEKLNLQKNKFSSLAKTYIIYGLELNVSVLPQNDYRHLIVLFKSYDIWLKFVKKYISSNPKKLNIFNVDDLKSLFDAELKHESIFIAHYSKSDPQRNFNDAEIKCFVDQFGLNNREEGIADLCLEASCCLECKYLNNKNLFYSAVNQHNRLLMVGSDRWPENNKDWNHELSSNFFVPIANYISVDEAISSTNFYEQLRKALFNKNKIYFSDDENSISLQNTNFKFDSLPHSTIICGKRGTGKTFLLDTLYKILGKKDRVKYVKQFEYAQNNEIKTLFNSIIDDTENDTIKRLRLCFNNFFNLDLIKQLKLSKNTIQLLNESINNKFQVVESFVHYNAVDNCIRLNYYTEFVKNYQLQKLLTNEEDNLINKIKTYIGNEVQNYIAIKEIINLSPQNHETVKLLSELITIIKSLIINIKQTFLINYKSQYLKKQVNLIKDKVDNEAQKITQWDYIFKPSMFSDIVNSFSINKIKDKVINKLVDLGKKPTYYDCPVSEDFSIGCSISNKKFDCVEDIAFNSKDLYFVNKNKQKTLASSGQRDEFFLLNKLWKDAETTDVFILDEPDYSFDNIYIRGSLSTKINNLIHTGEKFFIIATHNHVLWSELWNLNTKCSLSQALIYCNREDSGTYTHKKYNNFNKSEMKEIFEAGDESYLLRRQYYDEGEK